MTRRVPTELCGGPFDGRVGDVAVDDVPPHNLSFTLADHDDTRLVVGPDLLIARYVLVSEKPRKVQTFDDAGHARSEPGLRYRYDPDSPCAALIADADRAAGLTVAAREQVDRTRRLLLKGRTP